MSNKKRVIVAMSGGVDSSLAAALLVQKGYDVIGATMQLWDSNQKNTNEEDNRRCCSSLAIDDARRVAAEIGIPLYIFDFKDYFQKMVIDYFIYEYLNGRTPNPCIACNKYLKFKFFLKKALELGADFIATGHYGRVIFNKKNNRYLLLKGIDYNKDQSYFLYHLNQNILKHFLLPLGNLTKVKTREIAKNFGLSVAEKPDSQEICFISDNNYKKFCVKKSLKH